MRTLVSFKAHDYHGGLHDDPWFKVTCLFTRSNYIQRKTQQINNTTLGCVYHTSPVQVNKKLSTVFEITKVTAKNDEKLEALHEIHQEKQERETTVILKEFLAIPAFDKVLKCKKYQKKIQQDNSNKVVKCVRCGIQRSDRCGYGLSMRIVVPFKHS